MDKADREKMAFVCHVCLYQFRVMPFVLAEAPGMFHQLMSMVLSRVEEFAIVYTDDILVFSKDSSKHFQHLQIVFEKPWAKKAAKMLVS